MYITAQVFDQIQFLFGRNLNNRLENTPSRHTVHRIQTPGPKFAARIRIYGVSVSRNRAKVATNLEGKEDLPG